MNIQNDIKSRAEITSRMSLAPNIRVVDPVETEKKETYAQSQTEWEQTIDESTVTQEKQKKRGRTPQRNV